MSVLTYANRGRWFQTMLNDSCRTYQAQRRAYIHEVPVKIRFDRGKRDRLGRKQLGKAFFDKKASTDYLGFAQAIRTLVSPSFLGGSALPDTHAFTPVGIAFDAKSTQGIDWHAEIPEHQIEILKFVHELGHISGILLGFAGIAGQSPEAFWVPWPLTERLTHGAWTQSKTLALVGEGRRIRWQGWIDFLGVIVGEPTA